MKHPVLRVLPLVLGHFLPNGPYSESPLGFWRGMGYVKHVENHEFTVNFSQKRQKDHRFSHAALYFLKTSKNHTLRSGNSSPLFSGEVNTHFSGFSANPSIIRYRLEGVCSKLSKVAF